MEQAFRMVQMGSFQMVFTTFNFRNISSTTAVAVEVPVDVLNTQCYCLDDCIRSRIKEYTLEK